VTQRKCNDHEGTLTAKLLSWFECAKAGVVAMKIIVFGPTGGTGRLLLEKAIRSGHSVTAFTRNSSAIAQQPNLSILTGSVLDRSAVEAAVGGHDAVLSALGGRPWRTAPICGPAIHNITAAMTEHGVRRLVAISTQGAGETRADIGWFARNVIFRFVLRNEVKEAMERHLGTTGLDWIVVRVGILANEATRGAYRASDNRTIRGLGKIARSDVADFMLAQLDTNTWLRRKPVIVF
jgi:putative NADH-flavin reductase